jgi:polysaccharide biosynthesis/export protein
MSCGSYRQNLMFKVSDATKLQTDLKDAERNYVIRPNDVLSLKVYTNDGERIIDPDYKLMKDVPNLTALNATTPQILYTVDPEGNIKIPMIGTINVKDLSLREAEAILQKEYSRFYQNPFVVLSYDSKRVIVLGTPGGQVIPLPYQNITLVEVLALAKGINLDGKSHNIRILRGDDVFVADFSTVEGFRKSNMIMEPGDVVYVEPIRRPFAEGLRDYGPAISIVTSVTALIILLVSL